MPSCSETQVVEAPEGEEIDFGFVDSCMTVTCKLVDGPRVAGHFVQYGPTDLMFTTMTTKIAGRLIKAIRLVGQLKSWTPDLKEQPVIVERATQAWSKTQRDELQNMQMDDVDAKYGEYFSQFSIAGKPDDFKAFICQKFGCPVNKMSLRPHESGNLKY